jgi:hypothetical protein
VIAELITMTSISLLTELTPAKSASTVVANTTTTADFTLVVTVGTHITINQVGFQGSMAAPLSGAPPNAANLFYITRKSIKT